MTFSGTRTLRGTGNKQLTSKYVNVVTDPKRKTPEVTDTNGFEHNRAMSVGITGRWPYSVRVIKENVKTHDNRRDMSPSDIYRS